jgi:3-oxoadipate enol-lactonase
MKAHVNGFSMNFEVSGPETASSVVLHHPLATDLTFWDELTAALAPRFRVVRMDARGHGQSAAPKGPYPFETLAADVIGVMDRCNVARAAFVGLSMGGMIGQYLGLLYPARFSCLVLASTSSRIPDEARSLWSERVIVAREKGMASQVAPALQRWITPATMKDKPAVVTRLSRMIEMTPLEGYIGWCQTIGTLNITNRLAAIKLPTRIIVGAEDPSMPPATAEIINREIAGSDLVVMPGVSHQLALEDPVAFQGHVLSFLDRHHATQT